MKKITIIAIVLLLIFSISAFAAPKTMPSSEKIEVTLVSQEPDPANPGDVINVRFKIQNYGSEPTDKLIFEFVEEYPFSVYSGSKQKEIGSLQSWQVNEESVIILYKIKVDENAAEGEELIDIRYKKASDTLTPNWITYQDFPIRIRTRDLTLSTDVSSEPELIPPGSQANVKITITNNADSLIRDLKVKLDTSEDSIPFAPIKSTTEKSAYQLESKKSEEFIFPIIATPNSEGGVYKIPLTISYTDETGTEYEKEDVIGLRISSTPKILGTIESAETCNNGALCTLTIKIVNRGLTNIKLMSTDLNSNEDYEVFSQEEVYIGNIDSDDYETVEYKLKLNTKDKAITLPLKLSFIDSTNKEYDITENIIFHPENLNIANGGNENSGVGYIIIVLIVVGGLGIYFWKKKRKNKRK